MIRVAYSNCKRIFGLTEEQKMQIRKDLTFKNPAYESVLKYSKYAKTKVPSYLHYYKDNKAFIEVPMGYVLKIDDFEVVNDSRVVNTVEFPKFVLELRDIQKQATEAWLDSNYPYGTLVLPTGSGKSLCGIYLAGRMFESTLIVVNKDDLIEGWKKDIELAYNGEADVGLVKGKVFKLGKHFTLTTIQTLSRLGEVKLKQLYEHIGFIICDEVHHVGAASYKVLFNFPAMFRLGLTATKMRNDGLVDVIDIICGGTVFDGSKLKSDAIIAPENILIKVKKSNVKWSHRKSYYDVKTLKDIHSFVYKGNQFVEGTSEWRDMCIELEALGEIKAYPLRLHEAYAKIANDDNFNRMVCADIKRNYEDGKSCVVFCKTIEQLDNLYEMLLPSCPKIQKFYSNMSDSKEEVLKRAESKEVLVTLATIAIATEGTNVKSWEVGFLVSSVANEKDLIQIIGRLRRTKEGKEKIIFYDYRHPFVSGICYHGYKRDIFYKNMGIFNMEVE